VIDPTASHRVELALEPESARRPDGSVASAASRSSSVAPVAPPASSMTRSAALGRLGEELAAHHLVTDDGLEVVARNWRVRLDDLVGELDLVARALDGTLVVVEVKTRRDAARFGGAIDAAGVLKQRRIRRLASAFVLDCGWRPPAVRCDLIAIDVVGRRARLEHVVDAW
jgi:putative endonuclease